MGNTIEDDSKKDEKLKTKKDIAKKGKGKEKLEKIKPAAVVEGKHSEETKDDQNKANKSKEGKRKKSKSDFKKKSKTSDASVGKGSKSAKSKGGKGKEKPKKEAKDGEVGEKKEKQTKSKGRSEPKSGKSGKRKKKSTLGSIEDKNNQFDDKQIVLQKLRKQFDRPVLSVLEQETEMNSKFIFPLSDAIDKK